MKHDIGRETEGIWQGEIMTGASYPRTRNQLGGASSLRDVPKRTYTRTRKMLTLLRMKHGLPRAVDSWK